MADPFEWIDASLEQWTREGLRRERRVRDSPQGARIRLAGRPCINFGSNDYLGLASTLSATMQSVSVTGWGSGASPMICGRGAAHQLLERRLSEFEGTEAALLFSSGYAANVGTITALVGKEDAVFSDAKNHASIIDGCRLSGARICIFPHRDLGTLQTQLTSCHDVRRKLIVTDSLFSMDGDLAPLADLAELAERSGAMLLVDEAHATGVFGARGRGVVEHFQVESAFPVRVGTLSKALGSIGGFAVGPANVIEWLAHRARTYFFSTAPPDPCARAALEALEYVEREPQRRHRVLRLAAKLRHELRARQFDVGCSESQIVPIILRESAATMAASRALWERGLFVPGIRPPSVPQGESLLRVSLSAAHSEEHVEQLLDAMKHLSCR